jgi:ferrous iron transport protein B
MRDTWDKTKGFAVRAGTIILFSSIAVWFLSSFNLKFQYGIKIDDSILANIGKVFSWFFYPILGEFNWAASVSAIQGLVAKEQVVSSLSVISGVSGDSVLSRFNPASAYAYVVFNLFSAPCFGAIAAMKAEFKSFKKTILAVLYQIIIAWFFSALVFAVGNCFV